MLSGRNLMILAAIILVAGSRGAAEAKDPHPDMAAMIAHASTAQDHEALAAEYEREAAAARKQAEAHEKMGAAYTGAPKEKLHLDEHCRIIAKQYQDAAKEFDAMAAAHRALAKEAKK